MTVTAKPAAAPGGEVIRAWLPIPRRYPFQDGFELLSTSSKILDLEDENSSLRSLYLNSPQKRINRPLSKSNTITRLTASISQSTPRMFCPADEPGLKPFLSEAPHVAFTPEMKALSEKIAGSERDPYFKAKRFYDWISEQIKYSYATEYSTIRNISDYCRTKQYGDCGQGSFLLSSLSAASTAFPPAGKLAGTRVPATKRSMIGPRFTLRLTAGCRSELHGNFLDALREYFDAGGEERGS